MKEGERGEGRGPKDRGAKTDKALDAQIENLKNLDQIEYLLYQSTQGVNFIFENHDIAKVLRKPTDSKTFFTEENMKKVQGLLSGFLDSETMQAKRSYLESLPVADFELLVRAYFHLVENTILAHSNIRH